jgi:LacI family transcriptional regulator
MKKTQKTTLKSMADSLGLSQATVSRALSGQAAKYRISPETVKAVLSLAEKLRFAPNPLARGLRLRRTYTLGLVIPDISNPFFANVARHIEREARLRGYSVMLMDTEENPDLEVESLRLLRSRMVDGLVVAPVGRDALHLDRAYAEGTPMVLVDRYFPESPVPYVASDHFNGARAAAALLIASGHRRIACIQGTPGILPNTERVRGFAQAHADAGLVPPDGDVVGDSFGFHNGYAETLRLMQRPDPPTALFAASNLIALGALQALSEANVRIPERMSLVAFDDQPYSGLLAAPLTTVAQETDRISAMAVAVLFGQIASGKAPSEKGILVPTRIVERLSVARIPPS